MKSAYLFGPSFFKTKILAQERKTCKGEKGGIFFIDIPRPSAHRPWPAGLIPTALDDILR